LRLFENREEVVGGWRRMQKDLHNLYTSPNVIRVIKSRRMRWVGHVAGRKPKGKRTLGKHRSGRED